MRLGWKRFGAAIVAAALAGPAAAYELVSGEVIAVQGDRLIARVADGVKEIVVPRDFLFEVNGQRMKVRDLAPGSKVTATIPTGVDPVDLIATELTDAEVAYAVEGTIVVKSREGAFTRFSSGKMVDKQLLLVKNGRRISANGLEKGDRISATVITKAPPVEMSDADLASFIASAPRKQVPVRSIAQMPRITYGVPLSPEGPPKAPDAPPPGSPAKDPPPGELVNPWANDPPQKVLPKTASARPLLAVAGIALTGAGLALTLLRRRERVKMAA